MKLTVAFDVYGTLIDPLGVIDKLTEIIGDDAARFAGVWRDKQIEYLFRRGLGNNYQSFSVCTEQALEYAGLVFSIELGASEKAGLLARYLELPAYPGVAEALVSLKKLGCRNFAFSNGEPDDLLRLLGHAGLMASLDGIVSVHTVRSYKPDPAVYEHFVAKVAATREQTWLVSANSFDVIGAQNCGWKTVWLRRNAAAVFDPWGTDPTVTVANMSELSDALF